MRRSTALIAVSLAFLPACSREEEPVANRFERQKAEIENKARAYEAQVENEIGAVEARLENESAAELHNQAGANASAGNEAVAANSAQ